MTNNVPNWLGATAGQAPQAAQVNQFLGTHAATHLYAGTQTVAVTTDAGTHVGSTTPTWYAQSFTTAVGQTAIGYVSIPVTCNNTTGSVLPPSTVSIYTNNAGAPGTALVTTTAAVEYTGPACGFTVGVDVIYPVPCTVTASTQYWIVVFLNATAAQHFSWQQSTAGSGASTSSNGLAPWTAQAYGLKYRVFDQSIVGQSTATYEDSGARWTATQYNTNGSIKNFAEYVVAQGTLQYVQGFRTYNYSGSTNMLLSVT